MATTEQLLKLSTHGAVVRIINDENGTFFNGGQTGPLKISPPLDIGDVRTEVEITVRRSVSKNDKLPYAGQLTFSYNRLDVTRNLSQKLAGFRPGLPTSTQVLLDELSARTGFHFETSDFVLEDIIPINANPYYLKAKTESLRWVGSVAVPLIDSIDLGTYIPSGLSAGSYPLALDPLTTTSVDTQPYLNATAWRSDLTDLTLNDPVVDDGHPLLAFLAKTVPSLGRYLTDGVSPWVITPGSAAYNVKGAQLIGKDESLAGLNPLVPTATHVARVRLSTLDTAYVSKDLLIPYAKTSFDGSLFTNQPRLKATAVINASDGTLWRAWLNTLSNFTTIQTLPPGLNLRFSGPDQWTADANAPSPTNLYNAVVQYNGSYRSYDLRGSVPDMNRILILTVSDTNTAYRGNLTFHYRAPIVINEILPDGIVGVDYDFDLNPRDGQAPYTFTLVDGYLAPDHLIDASAHVVGQTTDVGNFNATFDVRDASGAVVRYTFNYRVLLAPLFIEGTFAPATVGVPYLSELTLSGGDGNYSAPRVIAGTKPSWGVLTILRNKLRLSGMPVGSAETISRFTVAADSGDNQTAGLAQLIVTSV